MILVTSNHDFAPLLNKLRNRSAHVVLITELTGAWCRRYLMPQLAIEHHLTHSHDVCGAVCVRRRVVTGVGRTPAKPEMRRAANVCIDWNEVVTLAKQATPQQSWSSVVVRTSVQPVNDLCNAIWLL